MRSIWHFKTAGVFTTTQMPQGWRIAETGRQGLPGRFAACGHKIERWSVFSDWLTGKVTRRGRPNDQRYRNHSTDAVGRYVLQG